MSAASEITSSLQNALEPYIKSREDTARIRKVLALYLDSCLSNGSAVAPLALTDSTCSINPSHEVRGLQREYLKALEASLKARREHDEARTATSHASGPVDHGQRAEEPTGRLEEHLIAVKLRRKQQRLQTVERYLQQLSQKPAATQEFLDPQDVFRDCEPLSDVPKGVVDGWAATSSNGAAARTDVRGLTQQLEKSVLRAKLLLRREELLLEEVKARSAALPDDIGDGARLAALNITRNELIGWIENELSKASGEEDPEPRGEQDGQASSGVDQKRVQEQLVGIKEKYGQYVAARKALLQSANQRPQPSIKPQAEKQTPALVPEALPVSNAHLLSPHLESLLALAREQKGSILEKSHFNLLLAKQLKESGQLFDHLAEESQLLPSFPMSRAARRRSGFEDNLAAPSALSDRADRVKKWVLAADSAKIATLELVAGKVEEGQAALEASMNALVELDRLLGKTSAQQPAERDAGGDEQDIWIAEGAGAESEARKHTDKRRSKVVPVPRDIWSLLDGNLGLIKQDE